jgi:cell division protease FtsH
MKIKIVSYYIFFLTIVFNNHYTSNSWGDSFSSRYEYFTGVLSSAIMLFTPHIIDDVYKVLKHTFKNGYDILYNEYYYYTNKIKSDFVGQDSLKNKVSELIRNALEEESTTGILLYGPPGTGKTELAKYIAENLDIPYKIISPADFLSKYPGEAERAFTGILTNAIRSVKWKGKPYILIIDECEGIMSHRRQSHGEGAVDEDNNIKNILLQYMEGFHSTPGLVILAITNHRDRLDTAFLRPGRFTHQFKMDMPSLEDKRKIFDYYKEKYKVILDDTISTRDINMILAKLTPAEITYFFRYYKGKVMTKKIMEDRLHELLKHRV